MKKIMEMSDLTNAQKLDLILKQWTMTPERTAQKLPSLKPKQSKIKATKVDEYMNRFSKTVDWSVKSELDYHDTKSVINNIKMKKKKFVPPEKEEIWRQRR